MMIDRSTIFLIEMVYLNGEPVRIPLGWDEFLFQGVKYRRYGDRFFMVTR